MKTTDLIEKIVEAKITLCRASDIVAKGFKYHPDYIVEKLKHLEGYVKMLIKQVKAKAKDT